MYNLKFAVLQLKTILLLGQKLKAAIIQIINFIKDNKESKHFHQIILKRKFYKLI